MAVRSAFAWLIADRGSLDVILAQNIAALRCRVGADMGCPQGFLKNPEPNREALKKNLLSFEAARTRHVGHSPNAELVDPNSWNDEFAMLNRPGMGAIQTALFYDYRNNVAAYPDWQAWAAREQATYAARMGPPRRVLHGGRRGRVRDRQPKLRNPYRRCRPLPPWTSGRIWYAPCT